MSIAQALGISAAAFLTFADPQACLLTTAIKEAPARAVATAQMAWDAARRLNFDAESARTPVPDASIHARIAPL